MKHPILIASLVFIICSSITAVSAGNVFCYFASWTVYRYGNGMFDVPNIDPSLCTHISFAFVGISENGSVNILDSNESNDEYGYHGFQNLVGLRTKQPKLKVLLSMGGWTEGAGNFSIVAADPIKRRNLAQNVLAFLEQWGFDGFDLDWEYPGFREGSNPDIDRANYIALLNDLKNVLSPKGYLLTAAVSGADNRIEVSYDIPALTKILDFINVMVYDFHGAFDNFVGHVSPMYASPLDLQNGGNATYNVADGIESWLKNGADPSKINLGVVTYGRSFTLANPSNTELYAPIEGAGTAGPYTQQEGVLGYNEICELYSDWEYFWDDDQKVPHRVHGNQWVGYEDEKSLKYKVDYAKSKNLGGMMLWAFDTDDFLGKCGDKYPLLKVLQEIR